MIARPTQARGGEIAEVATCRYCLSIVRPDRARCSTCQRAEWAARGGLPGVMDVVDTRVELVRRDREERRTGQLRWREEAG
jgi:hypothetical protein